MKRKRIRLILFTAAAVLIVAAAVLNLNIERAGIPADSGSKTQVSSSQEADPARTNAEDEENKQESDGEKNAAGEGDAESEQPTDEKPEDGTQPKAEQPQTPSSSALNKDTAAAGSNGAAPQKTEALTCTFEIRCDTLTDHSKVENEAILPYIPKDGTILAKTEVEFTEGETVFDVLKRITREKDIQMEFRDDPLYTGGAYIEGINYLYEFDGGGLSGWMYKVNGKFPNYGCAGYKLKAGEEVVWVYTCDLGTDVGDNSHW